MATLNYKAKKLIEETVVEQFMLLATKLEKQYKVEIIYNVDSIEFLK